MIELTLEVSSPDNDLVEDIICNKMGIEASRTYRGRILIDMYHLELKHLGFIVRYPQQTSGHLNILMLCDNSKILGVTYDILSTITHTSIVGDNMISIDVYNLDIHTILDIKKLLYTIDDLDIERVEEYMLDIVTRLKGDSDI